MICVHPLNATHDGDFLADWSQLVHRFSRLWVLITVAKMHNQKHLNPTMETENGAIEQQNINHMFKL